MDKIDMKLSDEELTEKLREFLRFEPLIQWLFDMKVAVEIGQPNPAAKALAQLGEAQEAIREVMKIDNMPEKVKEDLRHYFEGEQFKEYLTMDEDDSLYKFSNREVMEFDNMPEKVKEDLRHYYEHGKFKD